MTNKTVLSDEWKKAILKKFQDFEIGVIDAVKMAEQAVLQSPEIQRQREEAERYRYLRGYKGHKATGVLLKGILFNGQDPNARVDEVIDAAMEQKS